MIDHPTSSSGVRTSALSVRFASVTVRIGTVRGASDMARAIGELDAVRSARPHIDVRPSEEGWHDLAHVFDLQAMLGTAGATLRRAIARKETRGAHIRSDFPEPDPTMEVNFIIGRDGDTEMAVEPASIPAVSPELGPWMARAEHVDAAGKLLE